jgi:hypothetical protein
MNGRADAWVMALIVPLLEIGSPATYCTSVCRKEPPVHVTGVIGRKGHEVLSC